MKKIIEAFDYASLSEEGVCLGHTDEGIYAIQLNPDDHNGDFTMSAHVFDVITEDVVRRQEEDGIDEVLEYMGPYIMNYIDYAQAEEFFREMFNEMNESYMYDIKSEASDHGNQSRLVDELIEWDIITQDQSQEPDFDEEDYIEAYVEKMTDDSINDGRGGYDYYSQNFGEEEANRLLAQHSYLVDTDRLIEDAVSEKIGSMSGEFSYEGEEYYLEMASAGQHDIDDAWSEGLELVTGIYKADVKRLQEAWSKLHLKDISKFNPAEKSLYNDAVAIYNRLLKESDYYFEECLKMSMER